MGGTKDEIDWVARWRQLVQGRQGQTQRIRRRQGNAAGSSWDLQAGGFRDGLKQRKAETRQVLEIIQASCTPQSTVLDIGAGVGRYAIPLAGRVRQVFAVEPSEIMGRFLLEDAEAEGVTNLTVIPNSWEKAEVEPCDLVLCSHVLYFLPDIHSFLQWVQRHASAFCFVVVRKAPRDPGLRALWQLVHQEPRLPEPGLLELYHSLHQVLGICANVQVLSGTVGSPLELFNSEEDAMVELRRLLVLKEGSPKERMALDYLRERMVQVDGRYTLPGPAVGNAMVWWDNRPGSGNFVERC